MRYDILIKDGMIVDGTGKQRFLGDIGIKDGLIHEIGVPSIAGAEAAMIIPAFGKFVVPGFIDITSHADKNWSLFLNPAQDYLLTQGVTSILVGNCGASLAPLIGQESIANLRKWDQTGQANINWAAVGEFLTELGRRPLGVNVATLVGHGTARRGILKDASRALSKEEADEFADVVDRAMTEGAFGLSLGLVYGHERAASTEELVVLARPVAARGGIIKIHLRNEGADLVPAVNEAVQIARGSGAVTIISHIKAIGRTSWPHFEKAIDIIERAATGGVPIHFDVSPYARTGSFLYLLLPAWAREGGFGPMIERIKDTESRAEIVRELDERVTLHAERYIVAGTATSKSGQTLAEIARASGVSPAEAILELLVLNRGRVQVFGRTLAVKNMERAVMHADSIIASDGYGVFPELEKIGRLVHPRSTGTFPHFLHRFVRDREALAWEQAIQKITAKPAEAAGFAGRGKLLPRHAADVVVFDPDTFADRSTYKVPFIHPTGIEAVVVNGTLAISEGQLTGLAGGRVVRKA
ncbi:hypothetical protein C4552_00405 [Candidatus Parcubacteria bacterium]|nr:MAG: hypothetical protein C4552_00405 [Candidatus Parcubacteria bacterium]